ncbi:heme-degrading domain-containing protein [uncultured Aurantimicrobium sp.]|uniref:heme-degrading domain-containing protein n=1 Tax=uncultured Aurantimicrobium sp. TaxID=1705357 RepID=UPI00260A86E9|nr:heme-degrading domain-containing protein [uncultured Aurantimicrobium sp.]
MSDSELLADVAELERQCVDLRFDSLSHEDALALGMDLAARAEERNWPLAVSVFLGDQHVFRYACPGTTAENDDWIERKRKTVYKFQESSFLVGQRLIAQGKEFHAETGLDQSFAAHGGGFPLFIGDVFVGAVIASGVPQQDDHAIVIEALNAALNDE